VSTESTTLKKIPKKQPKQEHPIIAKAKEALTYKTTTPLMKIQAEPTKIELSAGALYGKTGYKVQDFAFDIMQWRKIPVSQEWLNGLARAIVDWSLKEDSLHIINFCKESGLSIHSFNDFVDKYPVVAQAKLDAQEFIAARRETLAFEMKASGAVMLGTQGYHSPSFKEFSKEKVQWSQPEQLNGAQQIVVKEVFPEDYAELQKKVALYEARLKKPDTSEEV
jgi:hypothetical protein